jgi:hypothetical protein
MAAEPIDIFSHKIDPHGVLKLLRHLAPSAEADGPEDRWRSVTLTLPKAGGKESVRLTFRHDADYYAGPGWPRQLLGMRNVLAGFPDAPRKADVLRLIGAFRFALAAQFRPDMDPDGDDRLPYLFAVAKFLDGVLFTPSSLRDNEGRVLLGADGSADADAVLPQPPPAAPEAAPTPPTAERVAQRALGLAAVAGRGLLEQEDAARMDVEANRRRVVAWVEAAGVLEELELDEWAVLQSPVGALTKQAAVNASWRLEGLGVLAWALRLYDLPAYDQLIDVWPLLRAVGFLDADAARSLLAAAAVRPPAELQALSKPLFALHWRLREFTLKPQAMDFATFAADAWFGPLDLTALRLIEGDLALRGHAVGAAPREASQSVLSATRERRVAINWLLGRGEIYSKVDTPT